MYFSKRLRMTNSLRESNKPMRFFYLHKAKATGGSWQVGSYHCLDCLAVLVVILTHSRSLKSVDSFQRTGLRVMSVASARVSIHKSINRQHLSSELYHRWLTKAAFLQGSLPGELRNEHLDDVAIAYIYTCRKTWRKSSRVTTFLILIFQSINCKPTHLQDHCFDSIATIIQHWPQ